MWSFKESWLFPRRKQELDVILSSSGVRAPCFVGGISALEERGYNIVRIAGVSGGAIIAAAYALGNSTTELIEVAKHIPYNKFKIDYTRILILIVE